MQTHLNFRQHKVKPTKGCTVKLAIQSGNRIISEKECL